MLRQEIRNEISFTDWIAVKPTPWFRETVRNNSSRLMEKRLNDPSMRQQSSTPLSIIEFFALFSSIIEFLAWHFRYLTYVYLPLSLFRNKRAFRTSNIKSRLSSILSQRDLSRAHITVKVFRSRGKLLSNCRELLVRTACEPPVIHESLIVHVACYFLVNAFPV